MKRYKAKKGDHKYFSHTAKRTKSINATTAPRGGFRL